MFVRTTLSKLCTKHDAESLSHASHVYSDVGVRGVWMGRGVLMTIFAVAVKG